MTSNDMKKHNDTVAYDCTLGKHAVILVSGEIIIDCVVETKLTKDEPRIDIYV